MRKTILTFGLISGVLISLMMATSMLFADRIGFEHSYFLGYTIIVASMLLVFFGIRSYRENVGGGHITFGRAFAIGLGIMLISCVCYVVTWEVLYFHFLPGFMDKWSAYTVEKLKAKGASSEAIQAQVQQMAKFKQMYDNPFINAAMTFIEPFPVGLGISLLSAAILRRKPKTLSTNSPVPASS